LLIALITLIAACDRGHHEASPAPVAPAAPTPVPAPVQPVAPDATTASIPGCTLAAIPLRTSFASRLVAVGDLHGDLAAARGALRAAGAIDPADHWIGGDLVVVQTGDVLDRGDDESHILELLARLDGEAHAAGGAVIQLLGNHELMNAAHDFRYVTDRGARDFAGDRTGALAPGGAWAKRLAQHDAIAIVGDTVFSHAGVIGEWARHVDEANLGARCWLDGQTSQVSSLLTSDDSPVWTRALGTPGATDCAAVDAALATLGAKRMVVAHTVQKHVTSDCDGKLWRIDVGMTRMFGGPIEVLQITAGGEVTTLHGERVE
jgi:hypothetical protein